MKDYYCLICQQDFQQETAPQLCPHCLGPSSMIVLKEDERKDDIPKLSFVTGENVASLVLLENEAAELAHWAEQQTMTINRETFQKISRSDTLHSGALRKLLKLKSPVPDFNKSLPLDYLQLKGQLIEKKRELYHAYLKAAQEALEPEIKELFLALLEAEERGSSLLEKIF